MSYNITGTTITLTRGDTFEALVSATKRDGTQYIPVEGDVIRFAMKENYDDPRPLLVKDIPIDTMMLTLEPQDTVGRWSHHLYGCGLRLINSNTGQ